MQLEATIIYNRPQKKGGLTFIPGDKIFRVRSGFLQKHIAYRIKKNDIGICLVNKAVLIGII